MKIKLQVFLIIILGAIAVPSYACECRIHNLRDWVPVVEGYIDKAPLIFIGKITPTKEEVVSIKVIDVFKGELRTDSIFNYTTNTSCVSIPNEGLAVIYAKYEDDSTIDIPPCGISRSIENFYTSQIPFFEIPHEKLTTERLPDRGEGNSAPLLLKNWMLEYALLNAYRNNHQKQPQLQEVSKVYLSYLALALSMVAVLVAFFRKQR
ncbi:MAG: hypothetical protein ACO1OQ_11190 [Rufibacter sp.]